MPHVIAFSYKEHDYTLIMHGNPECIHYEVATGKRENGYAEFRCIKCGMRRGYPVAIRDYPVNKRSKKK